MNLHAAVISHVGRVRSNNEDNFYLQGQIRQDVDQLNTRAQFSGPDAQVLFAVADGMTSASDTAEGARGGIIAARRAIRIVYTGI